MGYTSTNKQFIRFNTTQGASCTNYLIDTGGDRTEMSDNLIIRTIGNASPQEIADGMIKVSGSANVEVQDYTLLQLCKRNSTTDKLTEFDVEAGDYTRSKKHIYCKVDSVDFSCNAGEVLKSTVNWKGRTYDTGATSVTHSPSSDAVLKWHHATITGLHSTEITSFSLSINNNVDWLPLVKAGSPDARAADYMKEGEESVTLNAKFTTPSGVDLAAASLSYISSVVITFAGTNTVKFTLSNLKMKQEAIDLSPGEIEEFGIDYDMKSFAIANS